MLAPQDTHSHTHRHSNTHAQTYTQRVDCCGADARLSLSHVSLPYGRLLLLTFEMFFSLLLPLFLFLSISHSFNTHARIPHHITRTQTHTQTHTHTFQPLSILSLKGIAFEAWIKQMWLCKQCCFFKQHIGLSTASPHALQHSSLNIGMKTYKCIQMPTDTNFLEQS